MKSISWMPSWVDEGSVQTMQVAAADDSLRRLPSQVARWDCRRPLPSGWASIVSGLKEAGERLKALPIRTIVSAFDRAAQRFIPRDSRDRLEAVESIREATGLSDETIQRSLDAVRNYRYEPLWAALERDLGDPLVLDEFREDLRLGGLTRAFGPRLVTAIATGNVPGIPLLPMTRALLAKSPILLKVARGEPTFAAHFVRTLHDIEPRVADAIVVTYWDPHDELALTQALRSAECVIVYGGDDTVDAIRRHLDPNQRILIHGHKFSGGVLTRAHIEREPMADLTERLAWDVSMFDQHACLAPKTFVVEGNEASVDLVGEALAAALARYAEACPSGELNAHDACSLSVRRLNAEWDQSCGRARVWPGPRLAFTVVRSDELAPIRAGGDRFVVLVPAPTADDCVQRLAERIPYLQNVVLGAAPHEVPSLTEQLARAGACRICPPGRSFDPTIAWRHDGRACIAELVRWCDREGV